MPSKADGHSGAMLEYSRSHVKKRATGKHSLRLYKSAHKQSAYPDVGVFRTIPVLNWSVYLEGESFYFKMPYCAGLSMPEWFDLASPADVRRLGAGLSEWVAWHLDWARPYYPPHPEQAVAKKFHTVLEELGIGPRYWMAYEAFPTVLSGNGIMPIYKCHGDFTFANMLAARDGDQWTFWLFDHLSVFLESPLMDMAKLMQEFHLRWASRTSRLQHDRRRYAMAMDVLHDMLVPEWETYPAWRRWGPALEALTLVRILPYVDDDSPLLAPIANRLEELNAR